MKIIIIGIPHFVCKMETALKDKFPEKQFVSLTSGETIIDRFCYFLKFLYHCANADIIYSLWGKINKRQIYL